MNTEEIKQTTYNFLINKGINHKSVCAIMGNIQAECEFNPELVEVGSGVGFGLIQWSYERRTQLENYGTDLNHQLEFLYAELIGNHEHGSSPQWITPPHSSVTNGVNYNFPLKNFIEGNGSVEELTTAFCYCFERPAYSTNHLSSIRIPYAVKFSNTYSSSTNKNKEIIDKAISWMIEIANNNNHGYDQTNRWGPDYDCSSLVIQGYENGGIPVKSKGATYTGNMFSVFSSLGFQNVISSVNVTNGEGMKKGDVILASSHHVACYVGDYKGDSNMVVSAHINENGGVVGGISGDQTGHEIDVSKYYTFSDIDYVLRLPSNSDIPPYVPPVEPPTDDYVKLSQYILYPSISPFIRKFTPCQNKFKLIKTSGDMCIIQDGNIIRKVYKKYIKK